MPAIDEDDSWLEAGDSYIVDKHALARLTGEPLRAIERNVRDGAPTHGQRRRGEPMTFHAPTYIQWRIARAEAAAGDVKNRALAATARKREAEAKRLEGETVDIAEAEAVIRDAYATAQSRLLLIPSRFPEMREALEREILAAINGLATVEVAHD